MWKKILLTSLLLIVLPCVAIVFATYVLLGTERGFKWTTARLQTFDERLVLAPTTGNLKDGIGTDSITWTDKKLSVKASGIESKWRSKCLLKTNFCLEHLTIEQLTIQTHSVDNTSTEDSSSIELPKVSLPLGVQAEDVQIKKLVFLKGADSPAIEIENITLSAEARGSKLRLDTLGFKVDKYTVLVDGKIELEGDYPLEMDATVFASKLIDAQDLQISAHLHNTLANLKINAGTSGAVDIVANADIQTLQPTYPLRGNITWQELGWPISNHETVKATDGRLKIVGNLEDYQIHLKTDLVGKDLPETSVTTRGQINASRVILPEIDLFLLNGVATGAIAASWNNGADWIADLAFRQLDPGQQWEQMSGKLDGIISVRGSAENGEWAMNVDDAQIRGELRGFPLRLNARASRTRDGQWSIPALTLLNADNELALQGVAGNDLDINMQLDFPTIQALVPGVAGNIKATANISGNSATPDIVLGANTSLLVAGNTLYKDLVIKSSIASAGTSKSSINLDLGELVSGGNTITNIAGRINGTRYDHKIAINLNGPSQTTLNLQAKGNLPDARERDVPSGDWLGQLRNMSLELPGHNLQLSKPSKVTWLQDGKRLKIDKHCWQDKDATLCLEEPINANNSGTAKVALRNYQLDRLNNYLPANTRVEGELGATSNLKWNSAKDNPFAVELQADVTDGAIILGSNNADQSPLRLPYEKLSLTSRTEPKAIVSSLQLTSSELGNAQVDLNLDPNDPDKSINGKVALEGLDVRLAKPFLQDFDQVDGRINMAGDITGSLSQPLFDGTIVLKNPQLLSEDLPLGIEDGELTARVSGSTADIDGVLDTGKGEIRVTGDATWEAQQWAADLSVKGEKISIRQPPLLQSSMNPSLRIALTQDAIKLNGHIDIPSAEIDIKERIEGAATISEDVIIIEDEEARNENADDNINEGPTITTDLTIKFGENVNLKGYGLESRLTGDVTYQKDNDEPPQLGGQIRVVEGFYKSYGQDLEVRDGQILFVGPIEQTNLNIRAIRELDTEERSVGLHVQGSVIDPSVTLFTDPADKTQESILSYIVLGRDIGASTTNEESTLLAQAALALTIRQGRGFASGFAEGLGISDFQIDAAGSGDDTQVLVSGRLSRKLLLRYGRSVFAPDQTLYLRYDINKRLYLEAAQGLERAVDLFYSYSF